MQKIYSGVLNYRRKQEQNIFSCGTPVERRAAER